MDVQAARVLLKKRDWTQPLEMYNKLLENKLNTKQEIILYLLSRSDCFFELGNYEEVVNDCKRIIQLLDSCDDDIETRVRIRLVNALFLLKRLSEAEKAIREWFTAINPNSNEKRDIKDFLENFLERFFTLTSKEQNDLWLNILKTKFSNNSKMNNKQQRIICIYCNLTFKDKNELCLHCQTESHEMMLMSDDGHDWNWRAPPRGYTTDSYRLCENWKDKGTCRFGIQCIEAHGQEELVEWKERFQYREMKLLRAREKELYGKSYTEELLERLIQTKQPHSIMLDIINDVFDKCSCPLSVTVSSKNSIHEWNFILKSKKHLKAIALLQDTHRNHFYLIQLLINNKLIDIKNNQEWLNNNKSVNGDDLITNEYNIIVRFSTNIYGTFRQSVVFDFNDEPILVKHLCVDVVPGTDLDRINELRKDIIISIQERWTNSNTKIIPYNNNIVGNNITFEWDNKLKQIYPSPNIKNFLLSNSTVIERRLTKNNYKERMHELLYIEEMERYNLIAQYNLTTKLQIAHSYLLSPNSMSASTAKYSSNGELFATINLGKELSEDTSEGRLILMHCKTVYLLPKFNNDNNSNVRTVYEALIEDKGKNVIYLRLSSNMVTDLKLTTDTDLQVQIQFQLNRIPYCEWHYTIDKMLNYKLIFPETYLEPTIPWSPSRQWSSSLDNRLNLKQKEAVVAITTQLSCKLPPILVIGPFGTGKTFTLAQSIKELIKDDNNRILLCTHSNSAADLYIKDYFDLWVENGNENARPLRIYYEKRWVTTVSPVVQKYCSIKLNGSVRNFEIPTKEEIEKHKIIVVTLSTSNYLSRIGLQNGYFTHILLDEAAQAIECETITPLTFATDDTRIVLAGDHMQLGPDILSQFAKERNLHISLLERLYDYYPQQFPCKILLCENYRSHETIIQFTSELFYEQKLVSSSKQPKHTEFYPLTFFTTRGEDVQDQNSTAFYNNSEVYEVVERISNLIKYWPLDWGELNEQSIGVVTPYSDQVFRIRSELRKRKIDNVCVERVLNVQGKQFRAIILSTVRTRRTCIHNNNNNKTKMNDENINNNVDYGFLSNSKLLNTAITRAQSLVAVVGDPIALCSLGRCSKIWERFIKICHDNNSLYGITWSQLKFQLDGIELKKIYTLNPLAPEFIPRKYKEINQLNNPNTTIIANNNIILNNNSNNNKIINGNNNIIRPMNNFLPLMSIPPPPQIPPPPSTTNNVQAFANLQPTDFRLLPMVYQAQPQNQPPTINLARPFIYNVAPPLQPPQTVNTQQQTTIQPQLPLPNGYRQPQLTQTIPTPLRVLNSHDITTAAAAAMLLNTQKQQPKPQIPTLNVHNNIQSNIIPIQQKLNFPTIQQTINNCNNNTANSKLIQFMNNVHFPEAQMLNDCINLLPQQMSLADMIIQPAIVQERWYNYLKETSGYEVAEKFKYLLHTTNQKGSRIPESNIFERTTPISSSDSPTFNWYDSPSNQINFNKPIYMREIENLNNENGLHHQHQHSHHQLHHPRYNQHLQMPQSFSQPMYNNCWTTNSLINKSNPLYDRHPRSNENDLSVMQKSNGNNLQMLNGNKSSGECETQKLLQKHVNEEFANLSINGSNSSDDLLSIFKSFANDDSNNTSSTTTVNDSGWNTKGSKLYKYFS